MIYLLLFIVFITIIYHFATRYSRKGRYLQKIPGPKNYPIIGSIWLFYVPCLNRFWEVAREVNKKYYPISKYLSITKAIVNVYHPDDVEVILSSQKVLEKGWAYDYLQPWMKTGLLTSTGDKWRQRRKILTPAFHFSILKKYMEIAREEGNKFIATLKSRDKEMTYDLMKLCSNYTLITICEAAMGMNLNNVDTQAAEDYKNAIYEMGKIVLYRVPRPYIKSWTIRLLPKLYNWQKQTLNTLHTFSKKLIEERIEYHKQTENKFINEFLDEVRGNRRDNEYTGHKKRLAMLDLLLAVGKDGLIDDEGIREEVDTFTFEGHDTSAMCLTYTLMLLAENKDAQDKARAEVTAILDGNNRELNKTDLQVNYLERCIKESLRLFPPVSTVSRYTSEDIQLKNAFVPAGTQLVVHFYDTHRDPHFWENPNKFDPDRFLPENSKNRHLYAYVPFSAGPRNCIGQKFAMMEMKYLLSRILYNFYLEPIDRTEDMKLMADIILRPLNPVYTKLIRIAK